MLERARRGDERASRRFRFDRKRLGVLETPHAGKKLLVFPFLGVDRVDLLEGETCAIELDVVRFGKRLEVSQARSGRLRTSEQLPVAGKRRGQLVCAPAIEQHALIRW